ncbi:hypothetical protein BDW69DRAFT_32057 [Aspergillus filifer]
MVIRTGLAPHLHLDCVPAPLHSHTLSCNFLFFPVLPCSQLSFVIVILCIAFVLSSTCPVARWWARASQSTDHPPSSKLPRRSNSRSSRFPVDLSTTELPSFPTFCAFLQGLPH